MEVATPPEEAQTGDEVPALGTAGPLLTTMAAHDFCTEGRAVLTHAALTVVSLATELAAGGGATEIASRLLGQSAGT